MSKLSWKAVYWPRIIEEDSKQMKERQSVYVYDYGSRLERYYKQYGFADTVKGNYLYINTVEMMQHTIDNWDEICLLSSYFTSVKRTMKALETKHLLKVIYSDRLEGFNALVAENDN